MIGGVRPAPIRMMGLSSGMDTDMIIQQMMRVHQFRIDQRTRQGTLIQWRKETHNEIAEKLRNFQNTFLNINANSATTLRHSAAFVATRANILSGSQALRNAVTVSTTAGIQPGNMRIDRVATLARNARIQGANRISHAAGGINPAQSLQAALFAGGARGPTSTEQPGVR